jgi:hypothetical protein
MSKRWNKHEIDFLKKNYEKNGAKYCFNFLERELYAIRRKANKLGITKKNKKGYYEKDKLKEIVHSSKSIMEVLNKMGLRAAGGNYKTVNNYIKLHDISIDHFETYSERNIRSSNKIPLSEILVENSTYGRGHLKKRLYKTGLRDRFCEICGQGEIWKGVKISLILDHVNGVYNDNRIENLRIVCPNCNAGLPTHGGKNRKLKKSVKTEYNCECGNKMDKKSKICIKCSGYDKRKVERPSLVILEMEIEENGYADTGRKYGVSDNAIRKWLK